MDKMHNLTGNNKELKEVRKGVYRKVFHFFDKLDEVTDATKAKDEKRPG